LGKKKKLGRKEKLRLTSAFSGRSRKRKGVDQSTIGEGGVRGEAWSTEKERKGGCVVGGRYSRRQRGEVRGRALQKKKEKTGVEG